ncbi:MAG: excinuclease ABC subunit UvrC [Armatimonadota bacterium]
MPRKPGAYFIKNEDDEVIYVGKARSLRNRLQQHVRGDASRVAPWAQMMQRRLSNFDYIVTRSETEALILEATLIKEHKPHFNIQLRDDKSYPYLRLTDEIFPRLIVIRDLPKNARVNRPGAGGSDRRGFHDPKRHTVYGYSSGEIFGPYPNASTMWRTRRLAHQVFGIRSCRKKLDGTPNGKPCLYYHMGQCLGPCTGEVTEEEYGEVVERVIDLLEGRVDRLAERLRTEMNEAAENHNFERAAVLRDKVQTIERLGENQVIAASDNRQRDIFGGVTDENDHAVVSVLGVRHGRLTTRETYTLAHTGGRSLGQIIEAAMTIHYGGGNAPARQVLVAAPVEDRQHWQNLLQELRGGPVEISVPQRGERRRLMELARHNARAAMKQLTGENKESLAESKALVELAEALKLQTSPERIECYDISNIQGDFAVGSMVVFTGGEPDTDMYRRFRIWSVEGQDDYAALAEVIRRRIQRAKEGDETFLPLPDLIVVDGGKGQLSSVTAVLKDDAAELDFNAASLAKRLEQVFVPDRSDPVQMTDYPRAQLLLQRIRDEAHRFAITYHRNLRKKTVSRSTLDEIDGIGPKRRKELLKAFPSIEAMKRASVEELAAVQGMNRKVARAVHDHLMKHTGDG